MTDITLLQWRTIETPIEPLTIVWGAGGLIQADFTDSLELAKAFIGRHKLGPLDSQQSREREIEQALQKYFAGNLLALDEIPVAPVGSAFGCRVWQELSRIPAGTTKTYGQIAKILDKPGAARAVGMACHNNPIGLVVPCHRVVGHNGALTGYAGGVHIKEWLLRHEGVPVDSTNMRQISLFG
jgi:O-6-methylguanine DNA methyltransferase